MYPDQFVQVTSMKEVYSKEKAIDTYLHMIKGTPIIYQGVLHNPINRTFGIPDLLIRSDYINKITGKNMIEEEDLKLSTNKFYHDYHYRVIEIKSSTLYLMDNDRIFNRGSISAHKAQITIYNEALGFLQGHTPSQAYIIGNKWKKKNIKGHDTLSNFGIIDFSDYDKKYIKDVEESIKWYRDLMTNGDKWSIDHPSNKFLYPNFCHLK